MTSLSCKLACLAWPIRLFPTRQTDRGVTGYPTRTHQMLKILEVKVTNEPVRNEDFWRKWAEETRRAAGAMHANARRQMHLIAEHYEMLAREARGERAGRTQDRVGGNPLPSSCLWWTSESNLQECQAGS
jgi:hypothetical protein